MRQTVSQLTQSCPFSVMIRVLLMEMKVTYFIVAFLTVMADWLREFMRLQMALLGERLLLVTILAGIQLRPITVVVVVVLQLNSTNDMPCILSYLQQTRPLPTFL